MNYDFPNPETAQFPSMVAVSVTNLCNFRCVHCFHPTYVRQPQFRPQHMETTVFRRIADELGRYPHALLRFIAWGEPLMHPHLVELVGYARRAAPRKRLTLITSGYLLTPKRSQDLMVARLDLVEVSIDAATPATYRRVRLSPDPDAFAVVEQNVREALRLRDALGSRMRIVVSYVVWPHEESEAEYGAFHAKWSGTADDVVKRPLHSFKGTVDPRGPLPIVRQPCYGLWARCHVNPWGQVGVCYNDWDNHYVLGDFRRPGTTIAGIWQGPELSRLRAEQCRGLFRGCCARCRDYNPDAWQHPYEEVVARCCPQ
jgi:pyruvate-formate lyase-activating enzyme